MDENESRDRISVPTPSSFVPPSSNSANIGSDSQQVNPFNSRVNNQVAAAIPAVTEANNSRANNRFRNQNNRTTTIDYDALNRGINEGLIDQGALYYTNEQRNLNRAKMTSENQSSHSSPGKRTYNHDKLQVSKMQEQIQ